MDTLYPCCAGLDVHKQVVVACVRKSQPGGKVRSEVRTFRTETNALLEMADWLTDEGVTHVAMESTGVYWKPICIMDPENWFSRRVGEAGRSGEIERWHRVGAEAVPPRTAARAADPG